MGFFAPAGTDAATIVTSPTSRSAPAHFIFVKTGGHFGESKSDIFADVMPCWQAISVTFQLGSKRSFYHWCISHWACCNMRLDVSFLKALVVVIATAPML
jgi:hypothetical protein